MKRVVFVMSVLTFLSSCTRGIDGKKYVGMRPEFNLKAYFTGPIKAWGIVQDRRGNVVSRFEADMLGRWDGDKGILEEVLHYYDNGRIQNRTWHISKIDDLTYKGTAGDIIGHARGESFGNAIYWTYEMEVPVGDRSYRLRFDDWMWAMDGDVIINRSYLKKFGITVAELTIFMQKQSHEKSPEAYMDHRSQ